MFEPKDYSNPYINAVKTRSKSKERAEAKGAEEPAAGNDGAT